MLIYILCFIISTFLLKLVNNSKNTIVKKIVVTIALLLPCILASVRDLSIGRDINVYLKPMFDCAKNAGSYKEFMTMKFFQLWDFTNIKNIEIGFSYIVYFVTKITGSISCLLFVIECLIIFPVYFGIRKYEFLKDKTFFAMLVFYLLMYNHTLNLMRQFIAIAITFWGMSSVINHEKRGTLKYVISIIIGFMMHKSAIISLLSFLIYKLIVHNYKNKHYININGKKIDITSWLPISIIVISFIFLFQNNFIASSLNLIGMGKYSNYISGDILLSANKFIKASFIIVLSFVQKKEIFSENKLAWFYLVMFVLDSLIISQLSSVFVYSVRIGYFFQIFNIFYFTYIVYNVKRNKLKPFVAILMIAYLLYLWNYTFVISNAGETVPFIFYKKN